MDVSKKDLDKIGKIVYDYILQASSLDEMKIHLNEAELKLKSLKEEEINLKKEIKKETKRLTENLERLRSLLDG